MVGIARTRLALVFAAVLAATAVACGRLLPNDADVAAGADPNDPASGKDLTSSPLDASADAVATTSEGADAAADGGDAARGIGPDDRIVFVTTRTYRIDELRGLDGADTQCMDRAAAGLPVLRNRTFKAWVSGHDVAMKNIVADDDGPWVRPDGAVVATSKAHLLGKEPLSAPIIVDETGGKGGGPVWTGTKADGTTSAWGTCDDWTSANDMTTTLIGVPSVTKEWTEGYVDQCGSDFTGTRAYRLYCFEVKTE